MPLTLREAMNLVKPLQRSRVIAGAQGLDNIVQVLVNLLSNASKYGPSKAEITISAIANQNWVRVQVADRGPGIPQDRQSQVFRRFMYPGQLDESAKVGAGLGLSVVKAVIEAHGGQVGVEDRSGGGSIFWFNLPKGEEE